MTADLHTLAASFGALSLNELDRRVAALGARTDRKYVVGPLVFERLVEELSDDHFALEVGGRRAFRYETVYFDTPALLTYHQHHQGRRKRFKCRTRLYADSAACAFEVKLRDGRDRTAKRKLPIDPARHGRLGEEVLAFLDAALREAYGASAPPGLAPTLLTSFTRLTLAHETAPERLTCDVALAFAAGDEGRYEIAPGMLLVETKTPNGNGTADRVLRRLGARPVGACSKYCLGVALARPDVRRNRFSRLLRRHFAAVTPPPATVAA
ncbi:MAG: polyphosphate polymerase domain-containing protein [Thermoleophilia bacterium]|nr:polyphosphate polymerase domain-containing protein [Thermoleophilia bacterium]